MPDHDLPDFSAVREPPRRLTMKEYAAQVREEQRRKKDELNKIRRNEALQAQFRVFELDLGEGRCRETVLFNVKTGQVGVSEGDVLFSAGSVSRRYRRIKAADGLRLVRSSRIVWVRLSLYDDPHTVPRWLFSPTNEPPSDWKPPVRRARLRAYLSETWSDLKDGTIEFITLVGALIAVLIGVVTLALFAFGGFRLLQGIAGLLEFGRKQL